MTKRLVLSAVLVLGALAGCSKDNPRPATTGDPTTVTTEAAPTTTTAAG